MNKQRELPKDLVELDRAMLELTPEWRRHLLPALQAVQESTMRRKKVMFALQEALGDLRVQMKYLVFDLEATRRERDELKNILGK